MPNRTPRAKSRSERPPVAPTQPPTVSPRWLAAAVGITFVAALICAWLVLCLIFWQGSWQLVYHPAKAITRTPASVNLAFDSVGFATTESGEPRLHGWWIPAPNARYTALYLHSASGNLSDTVDALVPLHTAGLNILAFDYRGYGESQFARPSEASWREDATWALNYLANTRNIPINSVVLAGDGLGASLALEVSADHPELAGVVLIQPDTDPLAPIFNDVRARLVPARLLVRDQWNLNAAASRLRIPSLWLLPSWPASRMGLPPKPEALSRIQAPRTLSWLTGPEHIGADISRVLPQWLDDLDKHRGVAKPDPQ